MKSKNLFFTTYLIFISLLFVNCNQKVGYVSKSYHSNILFERLDSVIYSSYPNHLGHLNDSLVNNYPSSYPFYFSQILNEGSPYASIANDYLSLFLKHPHIRQIEDDIHNEFTDFSIYQNEIIDGFDFYNSLFNLEYEPRVVTINSAGNFEVVFNDSVIYIGLDMYVGSNKISIKDNMVYPDYLKKKMDNRYLVSDLFYSIISNSYYQEPSQLNFVSLIISYGKIMSALQRVLPKTPKSVLMKYSENEYQYLKDNEYSMWEYIVKNKMLFSSNNDFLNGWINEAPFSPFTSYNGVKSPSRAGVYIGWQIVEQYIEKNNASIEEVLDVKNISKLLASYKPKK